MKDAGALAGEDLTCFTHPQGRFRKFSKLVSVTGSCALVCQVVNAFDPVYLGVYVAGFGAIEAGATAAKTAVAREPGHVRKHADHFGAAGRAGLTYGYPASRCGASLLPGHLAAERS